MTTSLAHKSDARDTLAPRDQGTVLVLGSSGLLGSAIKRASEVPWMGMPVVWANRETADLRDRTQVQMLFDAVRPSIVLNCAAVVGGIGRNTSDPGGMILQNLQIDANLIEASHLAGVSCYLNFSSNCAYPVSARRPLKPSDLFLGEVEETNFGFAQAKLSAIAACRIQNRLGPGSYKTLILSNLYGISDDFSLQNSHLVGAVVTKVVAALREGQGTVEVWGSGRPRRELTFADDVADFVVSNLGRIPEFPDVMNLGSGEECSVADLYAMAMDLVGIKLQLSFDDSKPDGVFSKLLDSSVAFDRFDWRPRTPLSRGMSLVLDSLQTQQGEMAK